MKTLAEVKVSDYEISLSKLTGKSIKDVYGYLSCEFDDPVFKISKIILDDDTFFYAEGEHDFPYLTSGPSKGGAEFDEEELQAIFNEENPDEDE